MIWISYLHADHLLGIPNLMERRQYSKELNVEIKPLVIIGPNSIVQWIKDLPSIIEMNFIGITIIKETDDITRIQTITTKIKLNRSNKMEFKVVHLNSFSSTTDNKSSAIRPAEGSVPTQAKITLEIFKQPLDSSGSRGSHPNALE
ncbi:hypothetical protein ACTFIV_000374 [Dictyostelium citrinum]